MNQWPMVKLGDICTFSSGGTPNRKKPEFYSGTIPWISSADINENGDISTRRYITDEAIQRSSAIVVPPGTLLLVTRTGVGKVSVSQYALSFSQDITAIEIKNQSIDKDYLVQTIRHFAAPRLLSKARGATILGVKRNDVSNLEIPLPPLDEQRRIARILGHSTLQNSIVNKTINKLNTARQGCIEKYVADPSKTPRLDSLANLQGGLSLSKTRGVNPVEVEYLRVANIQRNNLILDNLKTIRCTEKELERCTIKDGDILMLEANANPLEVGRAAVAKVGSRHLVFQNHLFRVRPKEASPIVLNALLSSVSVRTQLLRLAKTTSGLNTMTISQARSLRIPLRDELTTREFECQLTRIEQQKKFLAEKQSLLEELHQSLATRAFAGQL